ncbi:MAG: ribonuclease P protein component [Flavobacteriales bacterium]|nr:ribonuclease P protein component [Flavobacteriales bacterium]
MAEQRHTFPKSERLCGRLRMKEVATSGKSVNEASIRLVGKLMELPTLAPAQVAFAVPSRNLKRAVDRNRMKRLMREAYRMHKHGHLKALAAREQQCAWLFIFQGRAPITFSETRLRLTRAIDRWMDQHGV